MARSLKRVVHKHVQVAQDLRTRILSGALQPGDRLPSYAEMRAQGVSQPTLDRVHVQLQQEGLIVREHGRGVFVAPIRPKSGIIGFLGNTPNGDRSPYWVPLLQGIQDGAHDAGYEVLLVNPNSVPQWEKLDGLLVTHGFSESMQQRPADMPFVSLIMNWSGASCVLSQDYAASYALTEHLLELGHQRIAMLSASEKDYSAQRYEGYRDALQAAGISPDPRLRHLIQLEHFAPGTGFDEASYTRMREWLATDWQELGATALMAYNDDSAYGIIRALTEAGYRVPEDISITGFDGAHTPPGNPVLTTGKVELEQIGRRGVEKLLRLKAEGGEPDMEVIPASLRPGETTGPAPR